MPLTCHHPCNDSLSLFSVNFSLLLLKDVFKVGVKGKTFSPKEKRYSVICL